MSDEKVEVKKETKPKPVKRIAVKLVEHKGESALVEWYDGDYHRAYVPVTEFDFAKKTVAEDVLKMGIPYGVDWSQVSFEVDPAEFDREMKKHGVWTREDLDTKPNEVNAAIKRTTGLMRRQLINVAEKGGK